MNEFITYAFIINLYYINPWLMEITCQSVSRKIDHYTTKEGLKGIKRSADMCLHLI